MNDMRAVIVPKSDQINADDLLAGPMTIVITKVEIRPGTEQPVSIYFDGDNNKPYKCCKSMARVLVTCWGPDANQYVGRRLTLYRDPKVLWGGLAVGGIRISHMSHIDAVQTMALTATKGSKKPFTVKPLEAQAPAPRGRTARQYLDSLQATLTACHTEWEIDAVAQSEDVTKATASFTGVALAELNAMLAEALERVSASEAAADEPVPEEEAP